jgi:Domain of unknown function (DUF4234)
MVPYGDPNAGAQPPGMAGMAGAGAGRKGKVQAPMTVLLMCMFIPFYSLYHMFNTAGEINAFLGRDAISVFKVIGLGMITCGFYALYWRAMVYGGILQEVQQRAGVPNPVNHGFMHVVPIYNILLGQEELNKAWSTPG